MYKRVMTSVLTDGTLMMLGKRGGRESQGRLRPIEDRFSPIPQNSGEQVMLRVAQGEMKEQAFIILLPSVTSKFLVLLLHPRDM